MLEIRNTVIEMENTSDGVIGGQVMAEASFSELNDKSRKPPQTEMQRERTMKRKEQFTTVAQFQTVKHTCDWNIRRRKKRQ